MIDKKKRDTLKIFGATTALAAAPTLLNAKTMLGNVSAESVTNELANIDIKVRVSVTSNDLELLVSNIGTQPTNITQLTPSHLHTARGYFDMQGLMQDGPLALKPGEGVTVPLTKQASTNLLSTSNSLIKDLQDRVRRRCLRLSQYIKNALRCLSSLLLKRKSGARHPYCCRLIILRWTRTG